MKGMREKRKEYKDNSRESRVPVRSSADTDHDIESITEIMDRFFPSPLGGLLAPGANKRLRREAAPDMDSNEDLFDFEEVTSESDRRRDTKCHRQALSEFESEPFSLSATESETEFAE